MTTYVTSVNEIKIKFEKKFFDFEKRASANPQIEK